MRYAAVSCLCAGLLALVGCGQPFSNDDLVFIKSLPNKDLIRVDVPTDEGAVTSGLRAAQTVCRNPPIYYLHMSKLSTGLNGHITGMLDVVEKIVALPPTAREDDVRRWGPGGDNGREFQLVITRTRTATSIMPLSAKPPFMLEELFEYVLSFREVGEEWQVPLRGTFSPSDSVRRGLGSLELDFDAMAAVDPSSKERGRMVIGYDTRGTDVALELDLHDFSDGDAPPVEFTHYEFERVDGGAGSFLFDLWVDVHADDVPSMPALENLRAFGRWLDDDQGRIDVAVSEGDVPMELRISECWDRSFFMTFRQWSVDPPGLECGGPDRCAEVHREPQFPPPR